MKKSMICLLALAAAVMAFSCQRVAEIDLPEEASSTEINEVLPPEVKMITVSCTLPDSDDPNTKVTLTNEDSKGKVAWVDGDPVLFHGALMGTSGSDYYSYVATAHDISGDGKTAKFTIPEIAQRFNHANIDWRNEKYTTDLYALYPASAVSDFADGDEWFFVSSFKNTNHILLAGANDTRVDDGLSFTFINLTGAISFKVDSDGTGGFDSYTFSGNNNEVVGYTNYCIKMDRDGDTDDFRTKYTGGDGLGPTSGELTSITVGSDMSPWTGHDGTTINTIFFPNGANFSSGFTIKFYKNGSEVRRVSTNTAKNVAVGKYLDLGTITSHMYTYTPPTPHNNTIGVDVDDAETINLSASATSNCYMIDGSNAANAGKSFKFKATKGKGGDVLKGGTASVNIGGDDENDVVLLWATKNTDSAPTKTEIITAVDYDLQGDGDPYIVFKTPSTIVPGNAVIAAKNSNGDILWSWHIWITSTHVNDVDGSKILGATVMDRNLGALVATSASGVASVESVGMFYEWGRKDPFVGIGSWTSGEGAAVYGTPTSVGAQFSMGYAIANPTVWGTKSGGDWLDASDDSRWGATKTMYDPCPVGYRIASGEKGSSAEYPLWNSSNIATAVTDKGLTWEVNTSQYWIKIADGDNVVTFPVAGYVSDGAGSYSVSYYKTRAAIWFYPTNTSSKYHINLRPGDSTPSYATGSTSASRGCNVRCVAE